MTGMVTRCLQWIRSLPSRIPGGSSNLATEVSACLPVLELLESQILDAVKKGNKATDELSSSFGEMARRARDVVSMATEARRDESDAGVDQIRGVVWELLAQVRQTSQSTQQTADMLGSIEKDLQDVENCISQIEDIANRSRMVSLNGQIEAARAGEHGDGFAVVASETGDLASNVSDTSHKIREVVDRLAISVRTTCEQTRQLLTADQEATAACEQRVESMLSSLADYQHELEANLESTKTSSDELASAISYSVMTLQFQDAVSQRMHHVTDTMGEIRESIGALAGSESDTSKQRSEEWMEKLASAYCVDDERIVLEGQSAAEIDTTETSNVELF